MDSGNFIHIWFGFAGLHLLYLTVRLYPHFKPGYRIYFWLGLWMLKPEAINDSGIKYRNMILIFSVLYFLVGVLFFRAFQ